MGIAWGFVLKNPIPETLTGHGLRAIKGVLGVLFQLPGNFFKMIIHADWINQGHQEKYFQRPKKTPNTPRTPFSPSDQRPLPASTTTSCSNFYLEDKNPR
jgi:hypothetical protein